VFASAIISGAAAGSDVNTMRGTADRMGAPDGISGSHRNVVIPVHATTTADMVRAMTVQVTVKTVEPTPTAVVAATTTWADFPKMWRPMLDKVWSFLRGDAPPGLWTQGHNIMLYKDGVPNVEVGVEVSGAFDPVADVVASILPGGLVATATHTGPIAKIGDTHQAVRDWSTVNGYQLAGPSWEVYGDPDPSTGDIDVDVFWSLVVP
jgi:effector-binding domain-containing protein